MDENNTVDTEALKERIKEIVEKGNVSRIQIRKNETVITEHIIFSESHLIHMSIPSLKRERITVQAIDSIRSGTIDGR